MRSNDNDGWYRHGQESWNKQPAPQRRIVATVQERIIIIEGTGRMPSIEEFQELLGQIRRDRWDSQRSQRNRR